MDPKKLSSDLEQSFRRLAGQRGETLTLPIGTQVQHIASQRGAVSRQDVSKKVTVNISDLSHINVCETESSGLCIRTIFGDRLFALAGENAILVKDWVTKAAKQDPTKKIPPFPAMAQFQQVNGRVRLYKGEIIPA